MPIYFTALIAIAIITLIISLMVAKKNIKEKRETDYRALFIIGICFLPMGVIAITTENPGFYGMSALGLIYMAVGLAKRDKWKDSVPVDAKQKRFLVALAIIGLVVFLTALAFFLMKGL